MTRNREINLEDLQEDCPLCKGSKMQSFMTEDGEFWRECECQFAQPEAKGAKHVVSRM